ncbi:hypothetical protein TcasGA2_TC005790 [Tribolium castaneum]|uniref:Uncharacterized protein n=1 Tax=Tribolium castaneum TaxID=7070 RepID=D6WW91_TRICA|nr:hypothetical protein TcasGA2_TC005790 [Tribolium castaneum]
MGGSGGNIGYRAATGIGCGRAQAYEYPVAGRDGVRQQTKIWSIAMEKRVNFDPERGEALPLPGPRGLSQHSTYSTSTLRELPSHQRCAQQIHRRIYSRDIGATHATYYIG